MKFKYFCALLSVILQLEHNYCLSVSNEKNPSQIEEGIWGPMLEDWVTSSKREKRVMRIDSGENVVIKMSNKTQEAIDDRESKIYNTKITNNNRIQNNNNNNVIPNKPPRQVSETDLYLLGAIEKLAYKVDFMEKRLRKVEEMLYYVVAGNRIDQEPCPLNFTRVGLNCYFFASAAGREYDWKAASKQCRKIGAVLAEFETIEENQDIVAHIQTSPQLRGKDYWTGGLNPGLLWIWSNSARPVSNNQETNKPNKSTMILGDGRCLRLAYNPALRSYGYKGSDCSIRYSYVCEISESTSSNEITRIGRKMNILTNY